MTKDFTAFVWKEGELFVAQCIQVDIASQGDTEAEALDNLREALELHFEEPVATIAPRVHTIDVKLGAA